MTEPANAHARTDTSGNGLSRKTRLARLFLTLVLVVAAIGHFARPDLLRPAMPPFLPWPDGLIFVTGVLEIAGAAGLWSNRLRRPAAWCLVAYFLAILPAHFHVAINAVPMFGIADPLWLWLRIPFQAVFVAAAWLIAKEIS